MLDSNLLEQGRKGRVLHTHQSFYAFLFNREIAENGGVFVTRTRSLASLAPKSNALKAVNTDLSKMNPTMMAPTGGMVGSGAMTRGPKDRDIGLTVTVIKGTHKGYVGTIKDTNGQIARVELRTGNKVIMIEKEKIYERLYVTYSCILFMSEFFSVSHSPDGTLRPLGRQPHRHGSNVPPGQRAGMGNSYFRSDAGSPQANGGQTPFGTIGRTPNPYAEGGKTPAWNASSRTPNPYVDGGKTPAWNASSRTPNPYAEGGRTPAWNVSRTPNPYGNPGGAGNTTGMSSWGGATPGRNAVWGNATPARPSGLVGNSGSAAEEWGANASSWVSRTVFIVISATLSDHWTECSDASCCSYARDSSWADSCIFGANTCGK